MRVIIDAMGGDNAPHEIVRGALAANAEFGVDITLVGRGETLLQVLKDDNINDLPKGVEIAHASQVVTMEDKASQVIKEKPDASMLVALRLLSEDKGDVVVSAGNTGALLTASTLIVKRIKGVRRGALVPIIPTAIGHAVLIDSGANVESTDEYLLQFAYLGAAYAELVMGIARPRVGLLNNGAEASKGPPILQQANHLLMAANEKGHINFTGNVEAREAVMGSCDVIVTDGFTGNVFLKTIEGVGVFFNGMLKGMFMKNLFTKLAAVIVSKDLKAFKRKMDYTEVGGAPLLGMCKPIIKAHGSSNARAIRSAIKQAMDYANCDFASHIMGKMEFMRVQTKESDE